MSEKVDAQEVAEGILAQVRELLADAAKRLDQIERAYLEVKGESSQPPTPQPATPPQAPQLAPSPTRESPQSSQGLRSPQPSPPGSPWKSRDGRLLFHISNIGKGTYSLELPTPIPRDDPAITRFLIPRVLEVEKEKHPGFSWRLDEKDSHITALYLEGVEDHRGLLAVEKAVGWTVGKALGRGCRRGPEARLLK